MAPVDMTTAELYRACVGVLHPKVPATVHRPSPLARLCGLALLATLLFATVGAAAHRDHSPGSDATCVVHHWVHAAKSVVVSTTVTLTLSFSFSPHRLPPDPVVVAHRTPRAAPARAPPVA
jgi:hypothetical protein